ncbi:hypothetical protein ACTWPT_19635 [Nonomuraea sp. 3N208]|uniref:hypothetical protein n=1 Tax=Nonomuraea sp. 3N208 TaxID=3457421 RepID=UPI003FCD82D8
MGLNLPPELAGIMSMLGPWPAIDEDMMRAEGNADRAARANVIPAAERSDVAVRNTQQFYRGESANAMGRHWSTVSGDHLTQAATAMRMSPAFLDGGASVVSAVKIASATQAAAALVDVHRLLLIGGAAGGAAATARILMRRQVVGKILREGSEGTGKVLAPMLRHRVTDPMRRILENLRRPGGPGGSPALAGAGGRTVGLRPPTRLQGFGNTSGPSRGTMAMSRGGRGGGRGRPDSQANLTAKEQEAVEAKEAGKPYDRSIFNRAAGKVRQAEKFDGERNKQKRGRR